MDIIRDRIDNLLYSDDTDPFLNWNSPRRYTRKIGNSLILSFIGVDESISHPIPHVALDLRKYLI